VKLEYNDCLQYASCHQLFILCHWHLMFRNQAFTVAGPVAGTCYRTVYMIRHIRSTVFSVISNGLIELWFYVPLDTKQVILETFFPANLLA